MEALGFFEKTVKVVDRYGAWRVFQSIMFLGLFLFIAFYIPAMTKITVEQATKATIETTDKNKANEHIRNLEKRQAVQPHIYSILDNLLKVTKADRAFVIELHNGSNNLNGVPFLHGSVTYEKTREGLECIDEEYQNLSLSRFDMPSYLHSNFNFMGNIEDVRKIDKKLAAKLTSNDVKYIAITTLHDGTNEWGWFGVLYNSTENMPEGKVIFNEIISMSQAVSKTLNEINGSNE